MAPGSASTSTTTSCNSHHGRRCGGRKGRGGRQWGGGRCGVGGVGRVVAERSDHVHLERHGLRVVGLDDGSEVHGGRRGRRRWRRHRRAPGVGHRSHGHTLWQAGGGGRDRSQCERRPDMAATEGQQGGAMAVEGRTIDVRCSRARRQHMEMFTVTIGGQRRSRHCAIVALRAAQMLSALTAGRRSSPSSRAVSSHSAADVNRFVVRCACAHVRTCATSCAVVAPCPLRCAHCPAHAVWPRAVVAALRRSDYNGRCRGAEA